MNKKKFLIGGIIVLLIGVLAITACVFARKGEFRERKAPMGLFNSSSFNDQQKGDVKEYSAKIAVVQKEFIDKMVSNGAISKVQGDSEKQRIDDALKNAPEVMMLPGIGMGNKGFNGRNGGFGPGPMIGAGIGQIDVSKLSEQQKTDIIDANTALQNSQKELLDKLLAEGYITKIQSDTEKTRIDGEIANAKNDLQNCLRGNPPMMLGKIIPTNLTDEQKTKLETINKDFITKMKETQKQNINKFVADGIITKLQGDTSIKNIDNTKDFGMFMGKQNGPNELGGNMKNGRFQGNQNGRGMMNRKDMMNGNGRGQGMRN